MLAQGKSCYLLSPMDEGRLCESNGEVLGICVSPIISEGCLCVCVNPMRMCGYLCEPNH